MIRDLHPSPGLGVSCFTENGVCISIGKKTMIYLQNTTESQVMFIPRNGETSVGDLVFKAKNTIDLAVEIDTLVTDLQTSDLFFNLAIELPAGLPDGEYEYSLLSGEIPVSSGLLVIEENARPSEYNKEIQYEQYTSE